MTNWLKWRLCALLGTSLLVGGATYLHAQGNYPDPAKTPEEAGAKFFRFLASFHGSEEEMAVSITNRAVDDYDFGSLVDAGTPLGLQDGVISRAQFNSFDASPSKLGELMELLFQESNEPQYAGRVTGSEGAQTIVAVSPAAPKNREVVIVAEDGGYRVDLKATFAKWNNLSGEKLDDQWYRYTGATSPAFLKSDSFAKAQCQTLMKQQMLGILQYTQDYDEKMPSAREWQDVVQPYVKSKQIFHCPSLPKDGRGYAFHQPLSRVALAAIAEPAQTVNIYETSNPKPNWFGPGTGRAYRHLDGWNLAFSDGHVKWFKRDSAQPSFSFLMDTPNSQ